VRALQSDEIQRTLRAYGFSANPAYCDRVAVYMELLLRWNRKVSLTAVIEPQEILNFHFGESLVGIGAAGIANGRLADLGSGAGFPGLAIAMAEPNLEAMLIESNAKKAAFLHEVLRELSLEKVRVYRGRSEEVSEAERFDFVTARALGKHQESLEWAAKRLSLDGRAVLWVGSTGVEEIRGISGWEWGEPVQIPRTRGRFVAVGRRGAA
jgi:16S rRNA (guanine527-N7)-methyltransferase